MARAELAAATVLLLGAALSGCVLTDAPERKGDLVRIVDFAADPERLEEANDAIDVLAAIADVRFLYTHEGDDAEAASLLVSYVDEAGRERERALSDFTDLATIGRGDRVTIAGVLLTSPVEVRGDGGVLAARGGPARDWLLAGGYPLPLVVRGGLATWDLDGGVTLDAALDRLEVANEYTGYVCDEDGNCTEQPVRSTVRFTDGALDGTADLDGLLTLGAEGTARAPTLRLALDGTWTADATANVHLVEESTDPQHEPTDADFGFDLDLTADGDGALRLRFGDDRGLQAMGSEGDLVLSGSLVVWDDEHARDEQYSPDGLDDFEVHTPYEEHELGLDDNPSRFVAEALGDLWRMDLAPGDEFNLDTARMEGFDADLPSATLQVRVVDEVEHEVEAGTFDAYLVQTTAAVHVPFEGSRETFELPMLTTWIDVDSGLPIEVQETLAYDYDEQDFAPLFAALEDLDDGTQVTPPEELQLRLEGRTVAELVDWEEGLRMAPMAAVLLPVGAVASPVLGFLMPYGFGAFGPFGTAYPADMSYEDEPEPAYPMPPEVSFVADAFGPGGRITLVRADADLDWSDFDVQGGNCVAPMGEMRAGDVVLCSFDGRVRIAHLPTNTLVFVTML